MVNIKSSGAQSGRDFSYGASPIYQPTFIDLFNEVISKIDTLSNIQDTETFKIELNKIRSKAQKLISKHFSPSISQLKSNERFKLLANTEEEKLMKLVKELAIQ